MEKQSASAKKGSAVAKLSRAEISVTESTEKRDTIIREAYQVFYQEGFHAAGVDRALEGTGISKRTLYKYFSSKEDLIEVTINYYSAQQALFFANHLASHQAQAPVNKILSLFDWLVGLVKSGQTFGCFAVNAKVEYARKSAAIEGACDRHFAMLETLFIDLCKECGVKSPKKTASQLQIIFRGAIVTGQTTEDESAILNAKALAKLLLETSR